MSNNLSPEKINTTNDSAIIIHEQPLGIRAKKYIDLLSQHHAFRVNLAFDERSLLHELVRVWPRIPSWENEAYYVWAIISDVVHSLTTYDTKSRILLQIRADSGPLTPNTQLEPSESVGILMLGGSDGVIRSCILPPMEILPELDVMKVSSGLMVLCQRSPHLTEMNYGTTPLGAEAGLIYGLETQAHKRLLEVQQIEPHHPDMRSLNSHENRLNELKASLIGRDMNIDEASPVEKNLLGQFPISTINNPEIILKKEPANEFGNALAIAAIATMAKKQMDLAEAEQDQLTKNALKNEAPVQDAAEPKASPDAATAVEVVALAKATAKTEAEITSSVTTKDAKQLILSIPRRPEVPISQPEQELPAEIKIAPPLAKDTAALPLPTILTAASVVSLLPKATEATVIPAITEPNTEVKKDDSLPITSPPRVNNSQDLIQTPAQEITKAENKAPVSNESNPALKISEAVQEKNSAAAQTQTPTVTAVQTPTTAQAQAPTTATPQIITTEQSTAATPSIVQTQTTAPITTSVTFPNSSITETNAPVLPSFTEVKNSGSLDSSTALRETAQIKAESLETPKPLGAETVKNNTINIASNVSLLKTDNLVMASVMQNNPLPRTASKSSLSPQDQETIQTEAANTPENKIIEQAPPPMAKTSLIERVKAPFQKLLKHSADWSQPKIQRVNNMLFKTNLSAAKNHLKNKNHAIIPPKSNAPENHL